MSGKMHTNYFGRCIAEMRRKRNLRQKQVAAEASLDPSYLAALETGRRVPPREAVIGRIAAALAASAHDVEELKHAARLSRVSRALGDEAADLPGASLAVTLLELSQVLSEEEFTAIQTLIEGYRYRQFLQWRSDM